MSTAPCSAAASTLVNALLHILQSLAQFGAGEEIDFLFGEIDGRFHVDAQRDERGARGIHALRELTLQRTHRRLRGAARARIDEIRNGLGLRQIDLVVEEGALAELPCPRAPRAKFHDALDQRCRPPHHRRDPAVRARLRR